MITLLKNSLKASVRDSFLSIFLIVVLIAIGINCFNFSLYQFREAQRIGRISAGEYTYDIIFSPSSDSESLKRVLEAYAHSIESAYVSVCDYDGELRAYFCGNYDVSHGHKDLKENQIIVGEEKRQAGTEIDDTVKIGQREYTVIGLRASGEYDEISVESLHNQYMFDSISVTFKNASASKTINAFLKEIGTAFTITEVEEPVSQTYGTRYLYLFKSAVLSLSIVLCNIGFLSFFFLNKKENAVRIMMLCGATRFKTLLLNMFEILIYAVLGALLGNLFFFMFLSKGFVFDYSVSVADILISCTVGILITVLPVFVLSAVKVVKSEKGR